MVLIICAARSSASARISNMSTTASTPWRVAWRRSVAEVIAETERLWLRTWDDEDELRFYDVMNTPAVMRWLGGWQSPEEWSAGYQRLRAYQRDLGFTFWIVERKSDDAI